LKKGFVLWFTGLSGAGKSTLADLLQIKLKGRGLAVERLDGDTFREAMGADLGYTRAERELNVRRACYVAKLLARNGVIVLASFISPYREMRASCRQEIEHFLEVYVKCPLAALIRRDPHGLYKKALAGEIRHFTGISDPYEEPLEPEIIVDTDQQDIAQSLAGIISWLEEHGYLEKVRPPQVDPQLTEHLRTLGYLE